MSPLRTPPINPKIELPPDKIKTLSPSQLQAYTYLNKKRIFELFQFLICHLLAEQPQDPVAFLGNLLDRCMMFRSGLVEPPLLFTEKHVKAMYRAMDRHDDGFITREQYENGLKTMNIVGYNPHPDMDQDGYVARTYFIAEALECMTRSLAAMLRPGEVTASTVWKIPILRKSLTSPPDEMRAPLSTEDAYIPPSDAGERRHISSQAGFVRPALCNVPGFKRPPPRLKQAVVEPPESPEIKEEAVVESPETVEKELDVVELLGLKPESQEPLITEFPSPPKCDSQTSDTKSRTDDSTSTVLSGDSTFQFVQDLIAGMI